VGRLPDSRGPDRSATVRERHGITPGNIVASLGQVYVGTSSGQGPNAAEVVALQRNLCLLCLVQFTEPIPKLSTPVTGSAFDAAIHDGSEPFPLRSWTALNPRTRKYRVISRV